MLFSYTSLTRVPYLIAWANVWTGYHVFPTLDWQRYRICTAGNDNKSALNFLITCIEGCQARKNGASSIKINTAAFKVFYGILRDWVGKFIFLFYDGTPTGIRQPGNTSA